MTPRALLAAPTLPERAVPSDNPEPVLPRVAAGDPEAVRECVARYGPLVWGIARRALGPGPDAEDAVQEAFVELWKSAGRFDPAFAPEVAFVAMVARRRALDLRRRAGRRIQAAPLADAEGRPDPDPGPVHRAELAEGVALAAAALATLPAAQQSAIRLAVCQGWTHEQIAAGTGTPLGTVKTLIRRGLLKVRDTLLAGPAGRGDS